MKQNTKELLQTSHLYGGNAAYIEKLFEQYCSDPRSIPAQWKDYFDQLYAGTQAVYHPAVMLSRSKEYSQLASQKGEQDDSLLVTEKKQSAVLRLLNAYRVRGHQLANLDPIGLYDPPQIEDLSPSFHNLTEADLDQVFDTGSLAAKNRLSLREIIHIVKRSYCSGIGYEYMHITETSIKRWFQQRIEVARPELNVNAKARVLERIIAADTLECFIHNKYVGQKRFSLEGGDSLIPMLDDLLQASGAQGIEEMVIGMAHRGRLNVLINILGKSSEDLFNEFEGNSEIKGAGDVKYHKGYSSNITTAAKNLHLVLAFNPSHLEIVSPVVQGSVRARQQRYEDKEGERVISIAIHGDSAFAGQGVVMETFQMSQVRGFKTGGTIHIVINNQVGFTTSNPNDIRSTLYCTDIAKMVQAPILHVNGDDPEAVIFVSRLALEYRNTFHKDVVIDLVCYRRHGHNEADEPAVTQPIMYKKIRSHGRLAELYAQELVENGDLSQEFVDQLNSSYRSRLEAGEVVALNVSEKDHNNGFLVNWKPYFDKNWDMEYKSELSLEHLRMVGEYLQILPPGFELHSRVSRIVDDRRKMEAGALPFNWGAAEILAYGTLIMEGYEIRLTGQDAGRGTFFHRHAVLHNQKDGQTYTPLQHLAQAQPHFVVIDSLLSEEAVLGYEYGYATAEPQALVIWEAQFGDFANGAQVVIDQFISSGESKWDHLCGLVMYLPHGYEGQGAEHSSARLERYLQLCAEYNMQVCIPSTPAQLFHMIRRQMIRPYRKPLVVMMPKSLLRHKLSVSTLEDLYKGKFHCVIDEIDDLDKAKTKRIVLCSGKVYYDLLEKRRELGITEVAIIRLEQLYPFPKKDLDKILRKYHQVKDFIWCQEEPQNQGAWYSSQHHFNASLNDQQTLRYVGRPHSAAPAVGLFKLHVKQQTQLVADALEGFGEKNKLCD
ncbi:MAG: 2-oxoglutarate dehydrogenase E1 component [Pseudomonadota bacterium]